MSNYEKDRPLERAIFLERQTILDSLRYLLLSRFDREDWSILKEVAEEGRIPKFSQKSKPTPKLASHSEIQIMIQKINKNYRREELLIFREGLKSCKSLELSI